MAFVLRLRRTFRCLAFNDDDIKCAVVRQRRNSATDNVDASGIDIRRNNARFYATVGQNFPPRGNDQAVPESLAAIFVQPTLCGCKYECFRLNRPRLEQCVPMGLAGDAGECGRARDELGAAFGEARCKAGKRRS